MDTSSKFSELLKFPCHQDMRIIVNNTDECKLQLIQAINEILGSNLSLDAIKDTRPSKTGKYMSHTVRIKFNTAEEMSKLYHDLSDLSFVQHVL